MVEELNETQKGEIAVLKLQKEEAKAIINKYPKLVLKGVRVDLDANWKKAMVSFLALALINVDISKKQSALTNQISEKFNESLEKETKIEYNASNKKELQIIFRIKNFLLATGDVIRPEIIKLDKLIMPNKETIYRDLFLYYVGAKSGLQAQLNESQGLAGEIDASLGLCFQDAIKEGVNLEQIERETIEETNTREEIKDYVNKIYSIVSLQVNQ